MQYAERFNEWLLFDDETKQELLKINDENELEDRFYKDLQFSTDGLCGIMGAGPNRMNTYTIGKVTLGLAEYLLAECDGEKRVVIAFDSRNHSEVFAKSAAQVLAAKGITVYLFNQILPTPVLSFAVKHLHCTVGVMLTAGHRPKEYNGYKVYDRNGCQLLPAFADKLIAYINAITDLRAVPHLDYEVACISGLIQSVGDEVMDAFLAAVKKQELYTKANNLKVVYTPLHGTGNIPVRRILGRYDVSVVPEQEQPDGDFSTVRSPDSEEKDALALAIAQAVCENADLVLATDPDCGRVGIAVRHNGAYVLLTGNQVGALLTDFVLRFKKDELNEKSTLVKTILTNDLGANVAKSYGLQVVETLTGFKYIGDCIHQYEQNGSNAFVMGYDENGGYLFGTHACDKDAVVASLLICEAAAYYKANCKTLVDALFALHAKYGYYVDAMDLFTLKGKDGDEEIHAILTAFRTAGETAFVGVASVENYAEGVGDFPKESILKFIFENGSWLAVCPAIDEAKLRIYYSVCGVSEETANAFLQDLRAVIHDMV